MNADPFAVDVNAPFRVERVGYEQEPVLIVDNVFLNPDALLEEVAGGLVFGKPATTFPGVAADAPAAYARALSLAVGDLLADTFALDLVAGSIRLARFQIATVPPNELEPWQRLPHIDFADRGSLAFLHYLCPAHFGGTAFYRHKGLGHETLTKEQRAGATEFDEREMALNGAIAPGYNDVDGRLYLEIGRVDAAWNRLIVYRGALLHAPLIPNGLELPGDPRTGRLTGMLFVKFSPSDVE